MTKRRSLLILMAILLLGSHIFSLVGYASESNEIPIPWVKDDVYVYDDDNLFDDSVEQQINTMLINLEKQTSAEFAVITVKSLLGYEIESYSIKVANTLGIGKKDKDNGVLLLISRSDNRVRLEIGKGLEGILNDAKCGRILDEYFVPYRNNNEYVDATMLTVQAVINVIATDAGVSVEGVDSSITAPEPDQIHWEWVIVIIVIIIVAFIILNKLTNGELAELLIDMLDDIGDSDFGGGSGGGGFGGDSFGGGGASR